MASLKKILVLLPFEARERALLQKAAPEAEFCWADPGSPPSPEGYDVVIGNPPPESVEGCRSLRLLQLISAGADIYRCVAKDTPVACASGAHGPGMAEHLLAALLSMMKNLHLYRDNARAGVWRDEGPVASISGARVLIVGYGAVGGCFGKLAAACGARVTGVRRHVPPVAPPEELEALLPEDRLDEFLPLADAVALCLPNTERTQRILSRERLFRMKAGSYLLNVGRGGAVCADGLYDALAEGRLAGACLDVTDPEPLPAGHRLWGLPNVLITPHVSGGFHDARTRARIGMIAALNLRRFRDGAPLYNLVDPETGYRRAGSALPCALYSADHV